MGQIITGDALAVLKTLPDQNVHCCVTSPPYWGLRDYGTATWVGGDNGCDHMVDRFATPVSDKQASNTASGSKQAARECPKCGARRQDGQLGLEPTPDEYVARLVGIMGEVRRVLRDDGTLWLNLGDSYCGSWANYGGGNRGAGKQRLIKHGSSAVNPAWEGLEDYHPPASFKQDGLKPKDLVGIPWRVAFALQRDGWYLRSDIIWAKPNPMPESVTDRPTKAHEYIFLLSKSPQYYYDAEAIKDKAKYAGVVIDYTGDQKNNTVDPKLQATRPKGRKITIPDGRNKRTIWTIPTQSYTGAHFAVFPPKLIEPCIRAGTSQRGACRECGAPWVRVVNRESFCRNERGTFPSSGRANLQGPQQGGVSCATKTLRWEPSCRCRLPNTIDAVPWSPTSCTVLDPFLGSGTTAAVAKSLGRDYIGIELNPEYVKLARKRLAETPDPLFAL